MKINFYTGTIDHQNLLSSGGVQFVLCKISSALVKLGYEVEIISSFKGDSPCPFPIDPSVKLTYLQTSLRHEPSANLISKISFWLKISKALCIFIRNNYSDYHISVSPVLSLTLLSLTFFSNLKIIVWENVQFHHYNSLINILRLLLFRRSYTIVSVSKSDHLFFIERSIDSVLIFNPRSNLPLVPELSSSNKISSNLLAAGRLSDQKGFDLLLDVAYILKNKYKLNFTLSIVGDGPNKSKLLQKCNDLYLSNNVLFFPFTTSLPDFYLKNSIFLLSSRYEGLPVVLLDSQSYGLPCIAFDCPTGPADVIINGYNGFLIDCFNIEEYAAKIFELVNDKNLLNLQSNNSISSSKNYEIDNIIAQWIAIFK